MHSYLLLLVEEQKNEESLYFVQKAETFLKVLIGGKQCRLARLIFLLLSAWYVVGHGFSEDCLY